MKSSAKFLMTISMVVFVFLLTACATTSMKINDRESIAAQIRGYATAYIKYGNELEDSKIDIDLSKSFFIQSDPSIRKFGFLIERFKTEEENATREKMIFKAAEKVCSKFGGKFTFGNKNYCSTNTNKDSIIFKITTTYSQQVYVWVRPAGLKMDDRFDRMTQMCWGEDPNHSICGFKTSRDVLDDYKKFVYNAKDLKAGEQIILGFLNGPEDKKLSLWSRAEFYTSNFKRVESSADFYKDYDPDGVVPEIKKYIEEKRLSVQAVEKEFEKYSKIRSQKIEAARKEIEAARKEKELAEARKKEEIRLANLALVKKVGSTVCRSTIITQDGYQQGSLWVNMRRRFPATITGTVREVNDSRIKIEIMSIVGEFNSDSVYIKEVAGNPYFVVNQSVWDYPSGWSLCQ